MCHEVHPPGVLGDSGNQDIIKTAFLLKMESQGDAGNLHITRPLPSDHVLWAWARSTLESISSISCRRPSQSAATFAPTERITHLLEMISNVGSMFGESRSLRDGRKLRRATQGSDESFPRPYLKLRLSHRSTIRYKNSHRAGR